MFVRVICLYKDFDNDEVQIYKHSKSLRNYPRKQNLKIKEKNASHNNSFDNHRNIINSLIITTILHIVILNHLFKVINIVILHPLQSKVVEVLIIKNIIKSPFPDPEFDYENREAKDIHPRLPVRGVIF